MLTRSAPLPVPRSRTANGYGLVMRWTVEEWKARSTGSNETPVVLITDSLALFSLLESIQEEPLAAGIDIVPGPNQGKPVLCIAVAAGVFAVDSGVVREMDIAILLTFLRGVGHAKLVSLRDLSFLSSFPFIPSEKGFPVVEKVSSTQRSRTPSMSVESLDADSLALHFGFAAFQARAACVNVDSGPLSVYGKIASTKRQRTLVGAPADPRVGPIARVQPPLEQQQVLPRKRGLQTRSDEVIAGESSTSHPVVPVKNMQHDLRETDMAWPASTEPAPVEEELFVEDPHGDRVNVEEKVKQYMQWFD